MEAGARRCVGSAGARQVTYSRVQMKKMQRLKVFRRLQLDPPSSSSS